MAWVRCCGGTKKPENVIFKNGVFETSILNPGGLYHNNESTRTEGFNLGANITNKQTAGKFYNAIAFLDIDFANINSLKFKYSAAQNSLELYYGTITSGNISATTRLGTLYGGSDLTQVIDVSAISGVKNLYVVNTNNTSSVSISEISYE